MEYAFPYLLLASFYGILGWWYRTAEEGLTRGRIVVLCIVTFILFFGLRGFVFYDWYGYYPNFNSYSLATLKTLPFSQWPYEPGFVLLMTSCKALYNNFHFFVFVCTCINAVLLFRFFGKYSFNVPLSLMVFLCMNGIGLSTDLMRNSISILLFINALEFLEKRRPIPYFAVCVLATSIHYSSLLFFPLYFFLHRRISKWVFLGVFIIGNMIFLLRIPVFLQLVSYFANYIDPKLQLKIDIYVKYATGIGFKLDLGFIERLFSGILVFIYYDKLRGIRENSNIFINAILLYFIVFYAFSEFPVISKRFATLFVFSYWIIWSDLIRCFSLRNNRNLFIAFLSIYCLLKTYSLCNYPFAKYDNLIWGVKSYQERKIIFDKTFNES